MSSGALTDALRETLTLFEESGEPRTTTEVAEELDLGRRSTYARLERLVERDRLETKKVGANARVWWRSPARPPAMAETAIPDWSAAAESLVDDVLNDVEAGIFVLDENFDVVWINEPIERYFGLEREHAVGRDKRTLVDERIAAAVEESTAFAETVLATYDDNTYTEQFECRVTAGDGRDGRWLEHRSKPIETGAYAGGRVELYYDVTDRKQSERSHRKERREFESIVQAVEGYAIFTLDPDGRVQTWNPGGERIGGYEADEILGEHVSVFYTEDDRDAGVPEENLAAAAERGSIRDDGWRVKADGSWFWATVTMTAIHDIDGELQGYVKVVRDMTERRRAETERELVYEATRSIAEAETFEAGLQAALRDVCEMTDWEYAEAWIPTDDGVLRRAEADYYADDLTEFAAFSESFTFARGEGLPGRVWASGEFEWAADLSNGSRDEFPRLDEALDVGLQSSVGVPVVSDDTVVAVLTFIVRTPRETDERLVKLVSSIAGDLGELIARRRAEERLERERELIEQVFETAPVGIAVFGPDRQIVRANEGMADLIGSAGGDEDGYTAGDLTLVGEDGEPLPFEERPVGRVFETGESVFGQEVKLVHPDGSSHWVSVNAAPFTDVDSQVGHVIATTTDVTRLKEQTKRLERRREDLKMELEEIFARVDDAFYALDDEMRFEYVNDRAEELLGYPESELLGRNVWEALSTADDDPIRDRFQTAMATQEPVTFERFSEPLDIWEIVRIYPSESGLSVYFTDITERKERELQLELYETIVETVEDGVYAVDSDARFVMVNDAFCEMTGRNRAELLGRHATTIHDDHLTPRAERLTAAVEHGERETASIEFDVRTKDGERLPAESRVTQFQFDDTSGRCGVVRDVSERNERERKLGKRIRQQEVVTELGERALKDRDLDTLMAEAAELVAETLGNDYAGVLDLSAAADELLLRQGAGWDDDSVGSATVSAAEGDSQAAYTLATENPVVLEDVSVESRYSSSSLLRDHDVRSGISTIVGSADDPWGVLGTYDTEPTEFSEQDTAFVQAVANILANAVDRHRHEQELIRQREQLAALDNINSVVREIASAVIDQSTREEIERTVCEHLANTDSYRFAWVGDVDAPSQTVNLRTEAGVDGYLDGITISIDPDDKRSKGPTGRALRTGEIQVSQDVLTDIRHDPWREDIEPYGFRSSAAVPIVHEGMVYGVLNVYAERPYAFESQEREVIAQLGELVGHAIAATDRKQALMSDELVELEFQIENILETLDASVETDGRITLDDTVPVGDGEFLVYGTATADAIDTVHHLTSLLPHWESVTVRSEGDPARFELRLTDPPVLSAVAARGGYVDRAVIEDGDYRMTIHLAPSVEARTIIETVTGTYSAAEMVRRRQISRKHDDLRHVQRHVMAELTDRQRTALEAAYHVGYFEWPRDATGEAVAESMDVAPPTFHHHLRKAERKVFNVLFSS
ncbi:PAS domain S-box protein [Natrinema salaciae]|uniref:PAS domain S-box-containing protein n=1 Tax=Natrinema salaciae TaxID=1186196 RepID=A0A1H9K2K9_9EURY|nr:PAS domain S-box protein [Natrinema salaciae]SEQ93163.1 PAS domain S-box-containing protein [Natrinema salaciae]